MSTPIIAANLAAVTDLDVDTRRALWNASGKYTSTGMDVPVTAADVRSANAAEAAAMVDICSDPDVLAAIARRERRHTVLERLRSRPNLDADTSMVLLEKLNAAGIKVTAPMVRAAGITSVFTSAHAPGDEQLASAPNMWLDMFTVSELAEIASYPAGDTLIGRFVASGWTQLVTTEVFTKAPAGGNTRCNIAAVVLSDGVLDDEWVALLAGDAEALSWALRYSPALLRAEHPDMLATWIPTAVDPCGLLASLARTAAEHPETVAAVPYALIDDAFNRLDTWDVRVPEEGVDWLTAQVRAQHTQALINTLTGHEHRRWSSDWSTLCSLAGGLLTRYELDDNTVVELLAATGEWDLAGQWFSGEFTANPPNATAVAQLISASDPDSSYYGSLLAHPKLWSAGIVDEMCDNDAVCEHIVELASAKTPEVVRQAIAAAYTPYHHEVEGNSAADLVAHLVCADDITNLAAHDQVRIAQMLLSDLVLAPNVAAHVAHRAGEDTVLGVLNGAYPLNPTCDEFVSTLAEPSIAELHTDKVINRIVADDSFSDTARAVHAHNAHADVTAALLATVTVTAHVLATVFTSDRCAVDEFELVTRFINGEFAANPPTDDTISAVSAAMTGGQRTAVLTAMCSADTPMGAALRNWLAHEPGLPKLWAQSVYPEAFTRKVIDVCGIDVESASATTWLVVAEATDGFDGTFDELGSLINTLTV